MPSFRIVVLERARSAKSGTCIEKVGTYNPRTKERVINAERVMYWLGKGAQATDTVHNMLISAGVIAGKKINVLPKKTVPVAESTVSNPTTPSADVPSEPVAA